MKQECYAIKFRISFDHSSDETVYVSREFFNSFPSKYCEMDGCRYYDGVDTDGLKNEYFNKEKIEQLKKELCKQIMEAENPFHIEENDLDGYPVDSSKIYK